MNFSKHAFSIANTFTLSAHTMIIQGIASGEAFVATFGVGEQHEDLEGGDILKLIEGAEQTSFESFSTIAQATRAYTKLVIEAATDESEAIEDL